MTDRGFLARRFETERPRLRAIATRLLGSTTDADDAVQETWLRLERADADGIDNLEAWLTTVVSRVSLDLLRAPRRTREHSWQVEPWRDEPTAVDADPAELTAQSDQVSVALLILLERLSPAERIAFVLHDVFGRPFEEIATVLERSPDAARQLASRGRRRVRGAEEPARPNRERGRQIVEAWLAAARDGNIAALLNLLDDGAVLRADYGTTTQLVEGARSIVEQAVLAGRLAAHSTPILIDGLPGVAAVMGAGVVSIMAFDIQGDRIVGLEVLADPKRLEELGVQNVVGTTEDPGPLPGDVES
ncbi:MAG TPA: sigma-70 family RNA polymerase sigma factor [Humibacter sp.]|nr:sigma-70 family RNA polymerase sigma factor [Humibacter sp.]